jgi:ABC-2 type transport system permease protein
MRSINIQARYLIIGKIFSYYIISMIQVACMLAVGRYIVPLFGGDTIQFGSSYVGLFLISTATAINAVSYGLFVSSFSKTTQMAGSVGLVFVIVMAAIGGIMVPKFVMPKFLQELSNISPLSWGMEGFLEIMLRNGSVKDILSGSMMLIGTGIVLLFLTGIILKKKNI